MGSLADAYVAVKPDTKDFGPQLKTQLRRVKADTAGRDVGTRFGSAFSGAAKKLLVAGAVIKGVQALGRAMTGAWGEGTEAIKTGAQTAAVIKSTGGAAKVTAGDVDRLSDAISAQTGRDDELITAGQNMLLTFTRVRNEQGKGNDIFTQATKVSSDLAVATGKDLVGANVMLGKALNDPTRGLTALTRVGVTFSDGQRKQIKSMQAHGDIAGAQKIILAELRKEFGGSAAAQATFGDKAKVAWANVKEGIGVGLIKNVNAIAPALTQVGKIALATFKSFNTGVAGSKGVFQTFADFLSTHQGDIVSGFVEGGKAVLGFGEGLLRMASGGLRGIGLLDREVGRFNMRFIDHVGSIVRAGALAFGWVPGIGPKLKAASAQFDAWSVGAKKGFAEQGKGAIAAADKLDGYADAAKATRVRLEEMGKTEVFKAKQRDAANAARIAIKDIGTNADGSQVKLRKWSDVTKLGALAQGQLKNRIKDARARMIEQRNTGIQAGATQAQLTKRWNQGKEALFKEFKQMGLSTKAARTLAEKYGKIPKKAETKVTQPGMPKAQKDTPILDRKINDLNNKKVAIDFSTNAAKFGVVIRGSSGSAANRTRGDGPPLGANLDSMIGAPASAPGMHSGGPGISRSIRTDTNSQNLSPVPPRFARIGDDVALGVGKQIGDQLGKRLRAAIAAKEAASAGAPGGKAGKVKVGRGWGPIQAAMRRRGARSVTTYPGHHPSMARARDVTPHNWAMANAARALSSVWYVIYKMRIASKNHGNGWRRYHPTNTRGDFRHNRHIHVARYDQGGILRPGLSLAVNNTGRNETVTPAGGAMELSDRTIRKIGEQMGQVVLAGIGSAQRGTALTAGLYSRGG
jgi:hypothetical protein